MSSKTAIKNTPESQFEHAKKLVHGSFPAEQRVAVRIFEKLAAQGHSESCYALGYLADQLSWCYTPLNLEEENIDADTYWFTKAFELFKKEAETGNLKSQIRLAEMYAAGCGTKKDSDKAAYWQKIVFDEYLRRAEEGDAEKQLAVAEMYQKGCITERNLEKAAYWHTKYSEHADANTVFWIAMEYLNAGPFEENTLIAETLLLKAAETADAQLLHDIGMKFVSSPIRKPEIWFKLLQKSAEMGNPGGKLALSRQYLIRHESSPDIGKIRANLEEARTLNGMSMKSDVLSEFEYLSKYYHDRAEYYLSLAQEGYNFGAALRIALRLLCWNPCNPPEEALSILEELASIANPSQAPAEFILGCLYDKGLGTEKDEKTAAEWFLRAAEHNYTYAQLAAGAIYLKGLGVEKDPEKAAYWLKKVSGMDGSANDGEYLTDEPYFRELSENHGASMGYDTEMGKITSMKKYVDVVLPWFTKEADNGNAAALLGVGVKLFQGTNRELSFPVRLVQGKSGVEYIKKAADQNYAPAQYQYGRLFYNYDKKAQEYMQKSAENGYSEAQNYLERRKYSASNALIKMNPFVFPRDAFHIEADEFPIPMKYVMESLEEEKQ